MDRRRPVGPRAQPQPASQRSPPTATGAGEGPDGGRNTGQVSGTSRSPPQSQPEAMDSRCWLSLLRTKRTAMPTRARARRAPIAMPVSWRGADRARQRGCEGPSHPTTGTAQGGRSAGALVTMVDCERCSITSSHQDCRAVPRQTPACGRAGRSGKQGRPGFQGRDCAQGQGGDPGRQRTSGRGGPGRRLGSETCVHGRPRACRAGRAGSLAGKHSTRH